MSLRGHEGRQEHARTGMLVTAAQYYHLPKPQTHHIVDVAKPRRLVLVCVVPPACRQQGGSRGQPCSAACACTGLRRIDTRQNAGAAG